jgi:ferredoxin-NADP reductase
MTGLVLPVKVTAREEVADRVVALELEGVGRPLPNWAPGAHIDVVLPDGREAQYSLCSEPGAPRWRIAVLRERGVSAWLHESARTGVELSVRGPSNHFLFAPTAGRRYVFVAGGIGITAILPMLAAARRSGSPYTLAYAGRSRDAMAFLAELEQEHPGCVEVFAADEGARLDIPARFGIPPDEPTIVYACGPAGMLQELEDSMAAWPGGSLHVERFVAKKLGPPVWPEPFTVDLLMSGITVEVAPDQSILEAVEAAGVLAPSSCRVGTCGTCEVPVVDGEIEHRDSILSIEEQQDGRTMMICVSRAACPHITIEL